MTDMRAEFEARFPNLWGFAWNGHTYDATSEQVDNGFAVFCLEYRARWEAWQAARALPEGWVAVPVELVDTARRFLAHDGGEGSYCYDAGVYMQARDDLRAMLAAAPSIPAQENDHD